MTVESVTGTYALAAWPWLASRGSGQTGAGQLRNLADGGLIDVPGQPNELLSCSPAWCRVLVVSSAAGMARIDLMRPDGTDRRQVASGSVHAAVADVAVLDRFEVLTVSSAADTNQQLVLYDITKKQVVTIADGVGIVLCRAGLLSWSTGDQEARIWHALDLHTLR